MMTTTMTPASIFKSLLAHIEKLQGDARAKVELEGLDVDITGSHLDTLDQAKNVVIVGTEEEERLQANADLSEAGRQKAMGRTVKDINGKLKIIVGKKAAERQTAYEQESRAIYAAPTLSNDSLVLAIRESDILRQLQAAPLYQQMQAYQDAVANEWASTQRTLKDAEAFGASEALTAFIQRVDRETFEQKQPKQAARLKTLQYSAETLQALALAIDFRLSGYGEVPTFKPAPAPRTMDLGLENTQQDPAKSRADAPAPQPQFN